MTSLFLAPLAPELLERYLSGTCDASERAQVDAWLAADARRGERLALLRSQLLAASTDDAHIASQAWQRMAGRIRSPQGQGGQGTARAVGVRAVPAGMARWKGTAWIGITGLAIAAAVFVIRQTDGSRDIVGGPAKVYATTVGQQATLTLSSGARVVLGPASSLQVQDEPGGGTTTQITGQALFHVAHATQHPFTVQTSRAAIRVLGTMFFVREYETDSTGLVVVTEGRVGVQGHADRTGKPTVADAGFAGSVNDSGTVRTYSAGSTDAYVAWTRGELVFRETSVADIAADLSRAYGVRLEVADSALARRRLTWSVQVARSPVGQTLHELTMLLGAHATQANGVITIAQGRRPASRLAPVSSPQRSSFTQDSRYGK